MTRRAGGFEARVAALAAAGLAIRLVYVLVLARHPSSAGDSAFFHAEANLIAHGHGFIEPFVFVAYGRAVPTAAHPPLYPLVLAGLAWLGGTGYLAQRCLGCVVGAVVIVLIGLLGRRVGGERAGLVAAAVATVYPTLVAADGALMSEALYGLMIVAALLTAFRQRERRDLGSAALLGALIALAALTRSEALLLLPLLAWPLALWRGPRRGARLAVVTVACVALLLPWSIRNWSAFHEPTLISHNDSTVLAGANCGPTYHGPDLGGWRFDCISPRRTLREGAQASRWRREGLRYIGHHAGRLPVVLAVRLLRTWDFYQPHRQVRFAEGRARWADEAGVAVYFVLLPLAVAGGVLLRRRSRAALRILLTPVALVVFTTLVGYGIPRFRHAAEPVIVVLAAVALTAVGERVGRRGRVGRAWPSRGVQIGTPLEWPYWRQR